MEKMYQYKQKMSMIFPPCIQYIIYHFAKLHDDQKGSREEHIFFGIAWRRALFPQWDCYQLEEHSLILAW